MAVYRPPKYNNNFTLDFENGLSGIMVDFDHSLNSGDLSIHVCSVVYLLNNYVLRCDNAVVKVWLGLGTKTTWLGLGKDRGLG